MKEKTNAKANGSLKQWSKGTQEGGAEDRMDLKGGQQPVDSS